MGLKASVESLEGIASELQGFYTKQDDGTYRLDIDGGFKTSFEIEGLSSALGKERASVSELASRLKTFAGIEAESARDALNRVESLSTDQAKQAEKFEADILARIDPIAKERDALKQANDYLNANLDKTSIENMLAKSKIFEGVEYPIYKNALMDRVRPLLKKEGDKIVGYRQDGAQVFDSSGNPAQGEALLDTIVKSLPDHALYFAGANVSGTGANPNLKNGKIFTNPFAKSSYNVTAQSKLYSENPELAKSLMVEAMGN